jgi:alpha-glucosidase
MRHVSRFTRDGDDPAVIAKLAILILVALRGTICLYQGEERALPEAELAFEDLRDPYGIRFWPAFKGRDGCRTPMPWQHDAVEGGFTTGTPWLPMSDVHKALAVDVQDDDPNSVLSFYRAAIAFRHDHPALLRGNITFLPAPDEILAFTRATDDMTMLCLFNLSRNPQRWPLPSSLTEIRRDGFSSDGAEIIGSEVLLPPLGHFFVS